jgi:hypothetical protein
MSARPASEAHAGEVDLARQHDRLAEVGPKSRRQHAKQNKLIITEGERLLHREITQENVAFHPMWRGHPPHHDIWCRTVSLQAFIAVPSSR